MVLTRLIAARIAEQSCWHSKNNSEYHPEAWLTRSGEIRMETLACTFVTAEGHATAFVALLDLEQHSLDRPRYDRTGSYCYSRKAPLGQPCQNMNQTNSYAYCQQACISLAIAWKNNLRRFRLG